MQRITIDGIPAIWREPSDGPGRDLVVWLPGFSGRKEDTVAQLDAFAAAGFHALSFDPVQHGERATETREALAARVVGNIRRHFWPILALTAEEFPRVIDGARERIGFGGNVMAGGISMGGDIAAAAAGADARIAAVAACIATPDWLRPGSHEPPGEPDDAAQACYDRRDPLTHLTDYAGRPAICFQCGELDTQVPPDGALRFVAALRGGLYADCPERLAVVKHTGVPHRFTDRMLQGAIEWFRQFGTE
ncbi:prolyl oligopeptidase family serine peptidase [Paenibacillus cymbidii]|uniref:prolyl oligopeptidase family serine peptidase n=1 Tax=Paenibacillus cymbidii TaxID=1639034 RepID=UPI001080B4BA|nr:prolyl oligopeptidase family serine peptidase [Paenibacillus cymbidii]